MAREGGFNPRLTPSLPGASTSIRERGGGGGGFVLANPTAPVRGAPIPPEPTLSGGIPSAAGSMGSAPTTNALVAARFNPAIVSNPTTLTGNASDGQGYVRFDIDRPTIVASTSGNMDGVFYYAPDRPPRIDLHANRSVQHGICYLSNPGTWWIKYSGTTCDVVFHDASDGGVASRYLSEPGCHYTAQTHLTVTSTVTPIALLAPNILRKSILIQNLTPTNSIRLAFDGQNPANGGPIGTYPTWGGPLGVRLSGVTGSVITLAGDTSVKGYVLAILEGGAATGAEIEIVEWI